MTTHADLAVARQLLDRLGITPDQLAAAPAVSRRVPTFAEYVPVVRAAVTDGTRRMYGTYWKLSRR